MINNVRGSPGKSFFSTIEWAEVAAALGLTDREFQIVQAAFDEQKEAAIAHELGVAERTVHKQIERLYAKLHVNSRVGLVLRVLNEHRTL